MRKRDFLISLGALAALPAQAQQAQQRVTRILVGASAGGATDGLARALANALSAQLGGQFVVDNKAGAAGNIAAQLASKAKPDGSTLFLCYTSHGINPSLYPDLPYDPVKDFTLLSYVASIPTILIGSPSLKANSVPELVALAKAQPGRVTIGVPGMGSGGHMATSLLAMESGAKFVVVPYKGATQAVADVIGGQIDAAFADVGVARNLIRAGTVKALGINSRTRLDSFPTVPAISEMIPGFDLPGWFGLMGPAGMDKPMAQRFTEAVQKVLAAGELRDRLTSDGFTVIGSNAEQFGQFLDQQIVLYRKIIKATDAKRE